MGEPSNDSDAAQYDPDSDSAKIARSRLINLYNVANPTPLQVETEWHRWREASIQQERLEAERKRLFEAKRRAKDLKEATGHAVNFCQPAVIKHQNPGCWGMVGFDMVQALRRDFPGKATAVLVMMTCLTHRTAEGENAGQVRVTQARIGALLGLSRQVVYRAVKDLKKRSFLISRGGHLYCLGPE